jgi:hypothetical protein
LKAEDGCTTDVVAVGVVNNEADNFVTSGNAVLRVEVNKYLIMPKICVFVCLFVYLTNK